jgi:hypothetical protein
MMETGGEIESCNSWEDIQQVIDRKDGVIAQKDEVIADRDDELQLAKEREAVLKQVRLPVLVGVLLL